MACRPRPDRTRFIVGDMEALPVNEGAFDVAYSVSALEHVRHPVNATIEICRAVRPGGLIVLTCDVDTVGSGRGDNEGLPHNEFHRVQRALIDWTVPVYPPMWFSANELLTFQNRQSLLTGDAAARARRIVGRSLARYGLRKRVDVAIFGAVLARRDYPLVDLE